MSPSTRSSKTDERFLTDLEDMAFRLGMHTGLSQDLTLAEAFLRMAKEFMEFLFPETPYRAILYWNFQGNKILCFPTGPDLALQKPLFAFLKKEKWLKKQAPEFTELPPASSKPQKTTKKDSMFFLPLPVRYRSETDGLLILHTTASIRTLWNKHHRDHSLLRLFQIILRVSELARQSESHLSSLIHHLNDGILLLSPDKEIKLLNPKAKAMLGLPQTLDDKLKAFILNIFKPLLSEFDSKKEMIGRELNFKYPVERTLKIDITGMKDSGQTLILLRDISHEKEVDRMKTEIVSTVSHELRTPLTAIESLVNNLLRGVAGPQNEKTQFYLQRMQNNTSRLSNLINNLLDLSKLEAGEVFIRRSFHPAPPLWSM